MDHALSADAREYVEKVKKADILVGIPSYNSALTIPYVMSQVAQGLKTYFPKLKSAIFISDGNSTDGTLQAVKSVQLPKGIELIPLVYEGISGKGSAIKAVFEAAEMLNVKAVVHVDSDLRSITPEWVKLLTLPLLEGAGFVTPLYSRQKHDGTITNFLCYPVTLGLYGKDIRQPIGGDFGLSIELVQEILRSPMWNMERTRQFGIDIFETHTALAKQFKIKQAHLGVKEHTPKDPASQLTPMFKQVVGTMLMCITKYEHIWKNYPASDLEVEVIGEEKQIANNVTVSVNLTNTLNTYKNSFYANKEIYRSLLNRNVYKEFEELSKLGQREIVLSSETWAKTVYSFIVGYRKALPFERERILDALRVLWLGKIATYIKETGDMTVENTERIIKEEATVFRKLKPDLINSLGL